MEVGRQRALLRSGHALEIYENKQCYGNNPSKVLEKLIKYDAPDCWVLYRATKKIQEWFLKNKIPCVVVGACHQGIDLPFVSEDYRAISRHAAGMMLSLDHRKIAVLLPDDERAGDLESEQGFLEGVRQSKHRNVEPVIIYHDDSVEGLHKTLKELFIKKYLPTAMLVENTNNYLTLMSFLAQRRLCIPDDISLIARAGDNYLSYILPEPARYLLSTHPIASKLYQIILQLIKGNKATPRENKIFPKFIKGSSLGPPPY